MGSLTWGTGQALATKTSDTFRKRDLRITRAVSTNDTRENVVTTPPERTISSGAIVRDNGTVVETEDLVWGLYGGGRTNQNRVASASYIATRPLNVDLVLDGEMAVLPSGDSDAKQVHTGSRIVVSDVSEEAITQRVGASGLYDVIV